MYVVFRLLARITLIRLWHVDGYFRTSFICYSQTKLRYCTPNLGMTRDATTPALVAPPSIGAELQPRRLVATSLALGKSAVR